jgi:hypothetical protein
MSIKASLIKFFQCATWTEGTAHGGDIGAVEISSGEINNIFDNISDAERVAGDTDYRKIYVKNVNADTWAEVKLWISLFTESEDDEISILRGGQKSTESTPVVLTGTATFTGKEVVGLGTSFLSELAAGEKIYNSTDDAEGFPLMVVLRVQVKLSQSQEWIIVILFRPVQRAIRTHLVVVPLSRMIMLEFG